MSIWDILIWVLIFNVGFLVGYIVKNAFESKSHGVIYAIREKGKTVYTLELNDYPETIQFKKKVILRVDASEESPDRE